MAGMLFSVPVFAVIRMLVLDYMDYREKKKADALCPEDAPDACAAEKENPPAETVPPEENGQDQ